MSSNLQFLTDHIAELFKEFVESGEKRLADFLAEIEEDLTLVWTVPQERQARFLQRLEHQVLGVLEAQRIETVNMTKAGLAKTISVAIRFLIKTLAA